MSTSPPPVGPPEPRTTDGMLSIGALVRATGIPADTLRTWERRYGFPRPERKASGHRRYPLSCLGRLRLVAEAIARGHRAGEVLTASEAGLDALLAVRGRHHARPVSKAAGVLGPASPVARVRDPAAEVPVEREIDALLGAVRRLDGKEIGRQLSDDRRELGLVGLVEQRIAPLLRVVGEAWAAGSLEVRHEHFVSERIGDLLRRERATLERLASGALVVLATLPGEAHALGLQMGALLLAWHGCRVLLLGSEVPIPQLARSAAEQGATAVGISVSSFHAGAEMAAQVVALRRLLAPGVALLLGGAGAPEGLAGTVLVPDAVAVAGWAASY